MPIWQIDSICNSYRIKPKRGAVKSVASRVADAVAKLPSSLVRKSDPGVVVRADGRVEIMRWGFHREFNPSINNARSDKLEGGIWRDAFQQLPHGNTPDAIAGSPKASQCVTLFSIE